MRDKAPTEVLAIKNKQILPEQLSNGAVLHHERAPDRPAVPLKQTRATKGTPSVAMGTVVDNGWCGATPAEPCPVSNMPRLQQVPPGQVRNEPEVCEPIPSVPHATAREPELNTEVRQPIAVHPDSGLAPLAHVVDESGKILVSEKHTVQVLHPSTPGQPNYLPTPGPARTRIFKHSEDYRTLTGEVTKWQQNWRLRYAEVHEDDVYGGSVHLLGDHQLDQLQEGQFVQVHGFLTPAEGRHKSPSFRVQAVRVLEP